MTRENFHEETTTVEMFNTALSRLLEAAEDNGIDVQGAWECPNDGAVPRWDVEIVALDVHDREGDR